MKTAISLPHDTCRRVDIAARRLDAGLERALALTGS